MKYLYYFKLDFPPSPPRFCYIVVSAELETDFTLPSDFFSCDLLRECTLTNLMEGFSICITRINFYEVKSLMGYFLSEVFAIFFTSFQGILNLRCSY